MWKINKTQKLQADNLVAMFVQISQGQILTFMAINSDGDMRGTFL